MIAYGKTKRGSSKIHPHNECEVCSENGISPKRERQNAKKECTTKEYEDDQFDLFCESIEEY